MIRPLKARYSVMLEFDHEALVAVGADPEGGDLRIEHRGERGPNEIDRVLDDASSWGGARTRIWFAVQQKIDAASDSAHQYWLVVGPDGEGDQAPLQDPEHVFLLHDAFTSGIDTQRWLPGDSGGAASVGTSGGVGLFQADAGAETGQSEAWLRSVLSIREDGIRVDVRAKASDADIDMVCGETGIMSFVDVDEAHERATFALFGGAHQFGRWVGGMTYETEAVPDADSAWHQYGLAWTGDTVQLLRDGAQRMIGHPSPDFATSDHEQLFLRLRVRANSNDTTCPTGSQLKLEIDWIRMRSYMRPEPAVATAR